MFGAGPVEAVYKCKRSAPKAHSPGAHKQSRHLGEGIPISSDSGGRRTEGFLELKIMGDMGQVSSPEQAVDCRVCVKL